MTSASLALSGTNGWRELTREEVREVGGADLTDVWNWATTTVTDLAASTGVGAALAGTTTYIGQIWMGSSSAVAVAAAESAAWAGGAVGFSAAAGYAVGSIIYNYTPVGMWAVDAIETSVNWWNDTWNSVGSYMQNSIFGWCYSSGWYC